MPRRPAHPQTGTLELIQDRAFDLFARYGYDGVSIGDIAAATGLSKGALYWHYSGKEALYLHCLQRLHASFEHYVLEHMAAQTDGVSGVQALFQGIEKMLVDSRIVNGVAGYWLVPSGRGTEMLATAQRAFEQRFYQVVEATLRLGVELGQFDLGGDLEAFAGAVMSLAEVVILPLRHQTPEQARRILDVLARTIFRAYSRTLPLPGPGLAGS